MHDIAILGGALIGLSIAHELATRGADVAVYDASDMESGASWASAGMLAPFTESIEDGPFLQLCRDSLAMYPQFVARVHEDSGIDPHLRTNGILEIAFDVAEVMRLDAHAQTLAALEVDFDFLGDEQLHAAVPHLASKALRGLLVHGEGSIDNRLLGRALRTACEHRGVIIRANCGAVELVCEREKVRAIKVRDDTIETRTVVNATGAAAAAVRGVPEDCAIPVYPVKGQMCSLVTPRDFLQRPTWTPGAYLVPREDGRLLIGATVEDASDTVVDPKAINALYQSASRAFPALLDFEIKEAWAGLRPATPDGYPFLGATPLENYFIASGHYRNGVLLAPITSMLLANVILRQEERRLDPFSLSSRIRS